MDSAVINAEIVYKKKINTRMSLSYFKVILTESLRNSCFSQKRKFTSDEPQLALGLLQALKEPAHIVQFTKKRRRCIYCY